MRTKQGRIIGALITITTVAAISVFAQPQTKEPPPTKDDPIRFTAFAVQMQSGTSGTLDIVIERWSTDAEREALIALAAKTTRNPDSQEPLVEALQDIEPRAGYIRAPRTLGWDIKYAYAHLLPDGTRQIVVVTDKPVSFLAAYAQARTLDYPFSLVEMRFPPGTRKGEGKLLSQTAISTKDGRLELEIYGQEPTRLTTITAQKRKGTS